MVNMDGTTTQKTAGIFNMTPAIKKKGRVNVHVPWVEKYRPKKVSEVIYQDEIKSLLENVTKGANINLPNLLFYGPPGTGKTSTILALAKELFGSELWRDRVLELNASDERGIQVVREKVKSFSGQKIANNMSTQPLFPGSSKAKEPAVKPKKVPPIKIVILDEADSMTTQAQSALRRIMEKCTETTRFCIICNYVSRIIEPIASRCNKVRFRPIPDDLVKAKILEICNLEGIVFDEDEGGDKVNPYEGMDIEEFKKRDVLDQIIKITEGDMRRSLTLLQTLHRLKAVPVEDEEEKMETDANEPTTSEPQTSEPQTSKPKMRAVISLTDVHNVSGHVPHHFIESFCNSCQCYDLNQVEEIVDEIIMQGYSGSQFLTQLMDYVIDISIPEDDGSDDEDDEPKVKIADIKLPTYSLRNDQVCDVVMRIGRADHALLMGGSEYLQLLDVGRVFVQVLNYPEPKKRRKIRKNRLE